MLASLCVHYHELLSHVWRLLGEVIELATKIKVIWLGNGMGEEEVWEVQADSTGAYSGDWPALTGLPSAALISARKL